MHRLSRIALMSLAVLVADRSLAEQVNADFVFSPPTPTVNTVPITVGVTVDTGIPFVGTVSDSDSASSTLSGNAISLLDIDFDDEGNITSVNTIAFTGGTVQFDDDLSLNLSFALGAGTVSVAVTDLAGQIRTPGAPAPVTGTSFPLDAHEMNVNSGLINATGGGLASSVNESIDLSAEPITATLIGNATLTVQLDEVVGNTATYSATMNSPFAFNQTIPVDADTTVSFQTAGTLLAEASFTRALPIQGDLDDDGDVDGVDLSFMFGAFTGPNVPTPNPQADLDGDGDVDGVDLSQVFSAFTGPIVPATVPEPATLGILGLLAAITSTRRRSL